VKEGQSALPIHARHALDRVAVVLLLLLCASWGLSQVAIKVANEGVSPVFQAGLRSAGAALLVLLWSAWRGVRLGRADGTLGWGLAVGVLFGLEFLLYFAGMALTTASRGVIFLYVAPFVVALGAHFFLANDRLSGSKVVGLVAAFGGVTLAFADGLRLGSGRALLGDALCLGAALLWAATTVMIKGSPLTRAPPEKTLLYQLGVSAVLLPVLAWLMHEPGLFRPTPLVLLAVAYQIVIVAFASYVTWFWLMVRYPASQLSTFTFMAPIFGVAFGGLLLAEPVGPTLLASVALIAAGICLVNRPARRAPGPLAFRR
jgi:drug/metabolite transporter (DMT)-like permease